MANAEQDRRPGRCADIQKLSGLLMSVTLTVPAVRIWSRNLYSDLARSGFLDTQREGSSKEKRYAAESQMIRLSSDSAFELAQLRSIFEADDVSAPFFNPAEDCLVTIDSSEYGWGARIGAHTFNGLLPASSIGCSSTFREMTGFIELLTMPAASNLLRGRVVKVVFDSTGAKANIEKGGPRHNLVIASQRIFLLAADLRITLLVAWAPRESTELVEADLLSKSLKFFFASDDFRRLCLELRTPGVTLMTDTRIPAAIGKLRELSNGSVLVVPIWPNAPWWPELHRLASAVFRCPAQVWACPWDNPAQAIPARWDFVCARF